MDINDFRTILTAFADEPSDVDIRAGKVVAQVREDLIDATIHYSDGDDRQLRIVENEQEYPARTWLINRVARLPQLADRILATTTVPPDVAAKSPFVVPAGLMSPELATEANSDEEVGDVVEALLLHATSAVPGATSVLYLTSDAGEGKTTVINRAANIQAQRYKRKEVSSLIVPIPLSGRAFLTFDDAVIAALVNKLRFTYLYFDAFIELVRMGAIVPAFDGYEEMLVEGSKGEAVSALGNLVQRLESSGTVFIAARKAFFEYLSFRTQAKLFDAIGNRSAAFSRLAICRWTKAQFCDYGIRRNIPSPEEVYETVAARLGCGHPLLTRAVLVRRLFDVIEGADRAELIDMLGANPHDYFFTFVDAIVKREASEKWLSRVSGDVMEPLLQQSEHHQLLAQVALEMWQSSTTSLRYDVLDVIVDIFCESNRKSATATRQVKERMKQHSLLTTATSRGQGIGFDHEDFQNFYLGEGLGLILGRQSSAELQAFLSVNIVPTATVEQAVQCIVRHGEDLREALATIAVINQSESSYSFCKENCGSLAIRLAECMADEQEKINLDNMFVPAGALAGRVLKHTQFSNCHFQPTHISGRSFENVAFTNCEFERLELTAMEPLSGCTFDECRVDSLVTTPDEVQIFDPALIAGTLQALGASKGEDESRPLRVEAQDDRVRLLERFLRVFLRHTHVDEDTIRLRLGKRFSSMFFEQTLPLLISHGVLEETSWRGQGVQRRFKLLRQMSELAAALEESEGSFDRFLDALNR